MTRKEINEIKSQYTLEDCAICKNERMFMLTEKKIKLQKLTKYFLNLPEEEKHKYF